MAPSPIIIVSGPPGSGKTTVARLLAGQQERSAHVLGDHFFRYLRGGWIDPSLPEANDQNRHVMSISATTAAGYARGGWTTFLDGIYGPWFLDVVQDAVGEVDLHYVVLRADLATSLQRTAERVPEPDDVSISQRESHDLDRLVRVMHEQFDQLAQYERFVVDTTTSTPDEVAATVVQRLEQGDFRLA